MQSQFFGRGAVSSSLAWARKRPSEMSVHSMSAGEPKKGRESRSREVRRPNHFAAPDAVLVGCSEAPSRLQLEQVQAGQPERRDRGKMPPILAAAVPQSICG